MFDFFRRHTRLLQFILVLLVFPAFVFFGVQGYSDPSGSRQEIATVAGRPINQQDFELYMRDRLDQVRRQQPNMDPSVFDTPQMRRIGLDALIRDRLLLAAADRQHMVPGDERLRTLFRNDPSLTQLRDAEGYVRPEVLASLGLDSRQFQERLREDVARRQVLQSVTDSALAPSTSAASALDAMLQQREVQTVRFDTKDQLAVSQPSDAEIESYYSNPVNASRFQAPEQATVEYVVLGLESLKAGIAVPEEELRKYYEQNAGRYTAAEERRASHILIKADKDAPKAERDKARAKAEALLAQVKQDPARFAELAKANSDDEGSAANGGDLDFFGRGAMVKPFEDAAFALKPSETSGIVESDFGFHIIRLAAARGGEKQSFAAVRPAIEVEVRNQIAQRRFSEAAVEFGNTVYEQSDSLKPAADKWKLPLQRAERVIRAPAAAASGALANPKFLEALFAADAVSDKRNTKAIDIGANQLASGRIVEHVPARQRPLADVKEAIRLQLAAAKAAAAAQKLGNEKLAAATAAPAASLSATTPMVVSRMQPRDLPRPLLDAILKAPIDKLPAFVGVDLGESGYAVAKITRLLGRDPAAADAAKANEQYAAIWGAAESEAYYAALKSRYGVSVAERGMAAAPEGTGAASTPR